MTITTKQDVLRDLRTQRAAVKAGSGDKRRIRLLRRLINSMTGSSPEQDRKDALQEIRDFAREPKTHFPPRDPKVSAANQKEYQESALILLEALPSLPDDDPNPTVLDKKKIKVQLRQAAKNVDVPATLTSWIFDRLEQHFDDYLPERPEEVKIAALLAKLTGPELSFKELQTTLLEIQNLRSSLKKS